MVCVITAHAGQGGGSPALRYLLLFMRHTGYLHTVAFVYWDFPAGHRATSTHGEWN